MDRPEIEKTEYSTQWPPFSQFGVRMSSPSGIGELMDDLARALQCSDPGRSIYMLGGGNPSRIADLTALFRHLGRRLFLNDHETYRATGVYDPPEGNADLRRRIAAYLQRKYGWSVSESQIALTSGSQCSFFLLFNMLAGPMPNGKRKRILLPILPEYIGYSDIGMEPGYFIGIPGIRNETGEHRFKYRLDLEAVDHTLQKHTDISFICLSRPTNPTGNVITDSELSALSDMAIRNHIPLMIDNAYGQPFPDIISVGAGPIYGGHIIHTYSFSKFGLPGVRTGCVLAPERIIRSIGRINSIMLLANNSLGPAMIAPLFRGGWIDRITSTILKPFYEKKRQYALSCLYEYMPGGLRWLVHEPEGAFFLWLWIPDLPITTYELYKRARDAGVFVIPGRYFFPGNEPNGEEHGERCLRLSFTQPDAVVSEGIRRLCGLIASLFGSTKR